MGRELGIHRIDFLEDGTAVIRHSNFNLCGRTDFTNDITHTFYYTGSKPVSYLIISDDKVIHDVGPLSVKVTVEDDYWSEKEFIMDYEFVERERIQDICNEHIYKDERELYRERAMLEDARSARKHTTNLSDFNNFSELIDSLEDHIIEYRKEASDYLTKIMDIEDSMGYIDVGKPEITKSYVLLTYSE